MKALIESVDSKKRLLDIKAVAAFLSMSVRSVYRLIEDPNSGFPRGKSVCGHKWTLESIEKFVARTPDIGEEE